MTRILLIGDIHMMDKAPRNAVESYPEDILEILRHTVRLEEELGCDAVVWAGDVFHHKAPSKTSHATVLRMIEIVKAYKNLYIVTGNHDISNDVLSSVREKQPLGVLLHAGAKELDGWAENLPLFGVPWQQDWLAAGTVQAAFSGWRDSKEDLSKSLVVTHAPIYPPAMEKSVVFELVSTKKLAAAMKNSGHLYYGHIHEDHGVFTVDGVDFANMGAMSRGSLTEYNRERRIKAAVWSPEEGFTEVILPHKAAEEVFKIEADEKKQQKLSLDEFLSDIGSTTLSISSMAAVKEHIHGLDIEKPVKEVAISLLDSVE